MTAPREQTFRATAAEANQTLAAALRRWMPGESWSAVRGLIERRRIAINGNLCVDSARRLQEGEVVKVTAYPLNKPVEAEQVRIRHLDPHVVVVEKPAGVTTVRHPEERDWPQRRKQVQPTLDEMLPRLIDREERFIGNRKPR